MRQKTFKVTNMSLCVIIGETIALLAFKEYYKMDVIRNLYYLDITVSVFRL